VSYKGGEQIQFPPLISHRGKGIIIKEIKVDCEEGIVKALKSVLLIFIFLLAIPCLSLSQESFHSGGVAYCEGCHTMHNSIGGVSVYNKTYNKSPRVLPPGQTNAYLMIGTDQGSTCLYCHSAKLGTTGPSSYSILTLDADMPTGSPPTQLSPGGDFAWLRKQYSWVPSWGGAVEYSNGDRKGHNIIASDFGYIADNTLTTAPGGTYPSNNLSCTSCHDPHGKYRIVNGGLIKVSSTGTSVPPIARSGSYGDTPTATEAVGVYRLLGGKNYQPKSLSGSYAFSYDPFYAVSPIDYNRSESTSDSRVSYGKGVSLWCANCHEIMHTMFGGYEHPVDQALASTIQANYNAYVKSGDFTGNIATAYTSLVPFQLDNQSDLTQLKNATTSTAGAASSDRVMCLSCHRAHASGWDSISRWNNSSTFLTVAGDYPGTDASGKGANGEFAQGRTKAEVQAAFYGRPANVFATYQRSLCNKCHLKD